MVEAVINTQQGITLDAACPEPGIWSAFSLGQLPAETVEFLAAHLDQCPACSSSLSDLEGEADPLVQELRLPPEEDPFAGEAACSLAVARVRDLALLASLPEEPNDGNTLPRRFGPYRLVRRLGEGSMGVVYQAVHETLKTTVALKILSGRRSGDPHAAKRFRREIETVSRLEHPHVIRATDAGEAEGVLYLVMEFAAGLDLARLLRFRGPLPVPDGAVKNSPLARIASEGKLSPSLTLRPSVRAALNVPRC